jgi:uncharacterized protein (DUF433 family)
MRLQSDDKRERHEFRPGSGIRIISKKCVVAPDTIRLFSAEDIGYIALMEVLDHSPIASSPEVLGGALVFNGTRVPVQTLLDYLNDGFTLLQFLEFFPSVPEADARSFLRLIEKEST